MKISKLLFRCTLFSVICLAILIITVIALFVHSLFMPSDKQVLRQFYKNQSLLMDLQTMLSQEKPAIIGITENRVIFNESINWVSPQEAGVSGDHFAAYQALMKKAGVTRVWRVDNATHFSYATSGFASFGWRVDFVHTQTVPSPLISSIDSLPDHTPKMRDIVYRPLGDDWYIRVIY